MGHTGKEVPTKCSSNSTAALEGAATEIDSMMRTVVVWKLCAEVMSENKNNVEVNISESNKVE